MRDDDQRAWGNAVLLKAHDRKPEEPSSKRLEPVKLVTDGLNRSDFTSTLHEGGKLLNQLGVLLVLLQVRLDLGELVDGSLESFKVLLARLVGLVIRARRWRGSGERAAFGNEVSKLGLVLPRFHGINYLQAMLGYTNINLQEYITYGRGSLHQLGPASPIKSSY